MSARASFDYHVVDVFTDEPYAGNALAVVLDADDLPGEVMQAIAREFNLSETTFVLAPTGGEATYRVRIFTPGTELPFAGHPSVGTAWLLGRIGRHGGGPVVQECGAGLIRLVVDEKGASLTGGAPTQSEPVDPAPYLQALHLPADALAGTPPRACGCGLDWAFLHVHEEAVTRAVPDVGALSASAGAGVCAFSYEDGRVHARVFAAGVGVTEDPATGSAALGLGVFLVASGLLPGEGPSRYTIAQGAEVGRPSRIEGTVTARGGRAVEVTVAGGVVSVAEGRLAVPSAD